MTLEEAKQEIENRSLELLEKTKNGKGYICPICGIGSIDDQNGIVTPDDKSFSCPGGCFTHTKILGIIALKCGIKDDDEPLEVVKMAAKELDIKIDGEDDDNDEDDDSPIRPDEPEEEEKKPVTSIIGQVNPDGTMVSLQGQIPVDSPYPEFVIFYEECANLIEKCNFMQSIGISKEIQERFNMGYCENWIHPNTSADVRQFISSTPRIIIPTSRFSYVARYCGDSKNVAKMQRAGIPSLFNYSELYSSKEPLFVCEDEIDALSMIECGYDAMAIGAISNTELLSEMLENKASERFLILNIRDNEDNRQYIGKLREKLKDLAQDSILFDLTGGYSCINEIYLKDRDSLLKLVKQSLDKVSEYEQEKIKDYQTESSNLQYVDWFKNGVTVESATPCISTKLDEIDSILDGGLYEGIYTLGSSSSLGKTTLALQLADGIASNEKTDVLIFSLETARSELIAKSISRMTAEIVIKKKLLITNAKNIREITVKEKYDKYLEREKKIINDACDKYAKIAKNIYMHESNGKLGVKDIDDIIKHHLENTKRVRRKTVAVIDYLQILAEYDEEQRTDKQNIELNMAELKRISNEYKIPILIISSYGFDSYYIDEDMDGFNDTKSIENASDVLISLNLKGSDKNKFNIEDEKKKSPREMEIKVLKNRNGIAGGNADMLYYQEYNLFTSKGTEIQVSKKKNK